MAGGGDWLEEGYRLRVRRIGQQCVTKCYILCTRGECLPAPFRSLDSLPQWLLSPGFRSWTHHETRVFTTGSLNNTLSPSPNFKTTTSFGATTLRPCASRNSSLTILISSLARLYLCNGIQIVTVIYAMTLLSCPLLSRCCVTRRPQTVPRLKTVLTSKTRSVGFFAK